MPGIITSSSTRSGCLLAHSASACSPLVAMSTWWSAAKAWYRAWMLTGWSSTTSRRGGVPCRAGPSGSPVDGLQVSRRGTHACTPRSSLAQGQSAFEVQAGNGVVECCALPTPGQTAAARRAMSSVARHVEFSSSVTSSSSRRGAEVGRAGVGRCGWRAAGLHAPAATPAGPRRRLGVFDRSAGLGADGVAALRVPCPRQPLFSPRAAPPQAPGCPAWRPGP